MSFDLFLRTVVSVILTIFESQFQLSERNMFLDNFSVLGFSCLCFFIGIFIRTLIVLVFFRERNIFYSLCLFSKCSLFFLVGLESSESPLHRQLSDDVSPSIRVRRRAALGRFEQSCDRAGIPEWSSTESSRSESRL